MVITQVPIAWLLAILAIIVMLEYGMVNGPTNTVVYKLILILHAMIVMLAYGMKGHPPKT